MLSGNSCRDLRISDMRRMAIAELPISANDAFCHEAIQRLHRNPSVAKTQSR